ncbi:hypothetical protein E3N88_21100 [Mikania micrantha]|uniref:Uncharacterized protein n=1 Tax=Mikania micrantha TaxID=192012 RepID=A0A5N6NLK4_9ASTR|nr:hypothetical protein E3N88_21100 [Mikania micrantha]
MDPNSSPRKMRILSYVITKIPSFKRRQLQELENARLSRPNSLPETYTELSERESYTELAERVSHLTDDDILANIRAVVVEVSQIRSVIKTLGDRPDPETVDLARSRYAEAESPFGDQFDESMFSEEDLEEMKRRRDARREMQMYRALISLDEMHETYSNLLVMAERRLQKLYNTAKSAGNLEELNISANFFESLPNAIGSLQQLQILNVSRNKLTSLPDGICKCRSLEELDAGFNQIKYLPANIGYGLVNLKKLSMPLNKLRSLPTSIGEMTSLQILDVHFNSLRGLPPSIGMLKKLEILNVGSNFSDLTSLPETIGCLTSLRELDICNNQIQQLPITFGRLVNLTIMVVDQNPLTVPPPEVVAEGVEAVKVYMSKRLYDLIVEEEKRVMLEREEQAQASWFTSLFFGPVSGPDVTYPYLTYRL